MYSPHRLAICPVDSRRRAETSENQQSVRSEYTSGQKRRESLWEKGGCTYALIAERVGKNRYEAMATQDMKGKTVNQRKIDVKRETPGKGGTEREIKSTRTRKISLLSVL
jgi:hypothetical protein